MLYINRLALAPVVLSSLVLFGCDGDNSTSPDTLPSESTTVASFNFDAPFNTTFPANYQAAKDAGFDYFVQLSLASDSSKKITILATDDSDEDLRQAISVWMSLLSETGENSELSKKAIFESMASRQATLMMANTESDIGNLLVQVMNRLKVIEPSLAPVAQDDFLLHIANDSSLYSKYGWFVNSQALGYNETVYIGETPYFEGYGVGKTRDASVEEILHITQAQGFSPITHDGTNGGLQKRITDHSLSIFHDYKLNSSTGLYEYEDKDTSNDYVTHSAIWSPQTVGATNDAQRQAGWNDWLGDDIPNSNPQQYIMGQSFSHEFFAAVADTYYGLYDGVRNEYQGMDNYRYISRLTLPSDATGFGFANEFLPKFHQYTARIDSAQTSTYFQANPSTGNTFKLQLSTDPSEVYTYKSQYLKNVKIIGNAAINILGNSANNYFEGNSANNEIDGSDGTDVLKVNGPRASYTITNLGNNTTEFSGPGIGTDKLVNVEYIKFTDQTYKL
ncbi:hypothetical protein [Vibrio sp. HN007]|uniref:hypothetical protein n=1 Tax=Vibrio iocasae TaxID=3098914 RepID=UPI0035D4F55F